jgi:hypothetical protein
MSGILFYNFSNGEGATARLDSSGNYTSAGSLSGFAEWTHIVGSAFGGLLFYNKATGEAATAVLDGAGHYTFVGNLSGFAEWTHIVSAGPSRAIAEFW